MYLQYLFTFQAQKPWAKKYDKVIKTRDEFHKACKALRTAEINERNQQGDTSISEDQVHILNRLSTSYLEQWLVWPTTTLPTTVYIELSHLRELYILTRTETRQLFLRMVVTLLKGCFILFKRE